ncbi:MAG: DUF3320 domain-containing protein, partial [Thermoanaerobaculia bacterium]|nr:DUF3320 domain-containing protein [Thermoanaerobaculia bacterium]
AQTVAAIERAKADPSPYYVRPASTNVVEIVRGGETSADSEPVVADPYIVASVPGFSVPIHEVPRSKLAEAIAKIVRVESPVHVDEAARRILDASGVSRMGSRIREAIDGAVNAAVQKGEVLLLDDFLFRPSQGASDILPRDRSALASGSRSFELIAHEEVQAAIREVISSSFGIATVELAPVVCQMLGFGQTSDAMRTIIEGDLYDLQSTGVVSERQGMLHLNSMDSTDV